MKGRSIILVVLFFASLTYADIGPKPSADYYVTFGGQPIEGNFRAVMLSCRGEGRSWLPDDLIPELNISEYDAARNCSWMPERMAWGGDCAESRCSFTYMLPEEYRLAVYLPSQQKTYLSEVTQRKNFHSTCNVELLAGGGMRIDEVSGSFAANVLFFAALALTLFFELLVVAAAIIILRSSWRLLIYVAVANIISLPIVWFLFPLLPISFVLVLFLAEVFAVLFEAAALHFLGRLTPKRALLLSIIMNAVSFILGGLLILPLIFLIGV